MRAKAKEVLNQCAIEENKKRIYEERFQAALNRPIFNYGGLLPPKIKRRPSWNIHISIDINLYHFLDYPSAFTYIVWEDLEVDFSDIERRYCVFCKEFIYRASNQHILKGMLAEGKNVAITPKLFELMKMQSSWNYQSSAEILQRTHFLLLFFKSISRSQYKETFRLLNGYIDKQILKKVLSTIINDPFAHRWIAFFLSKGINLNIVIFDILDYINDDLFKHTFLEKLFSLEYKDPPFFF